MQVLSETTSRTHPQSNLHTNYPQASMDKWLKRPVAVAPDSGSGEPNDKREKAESQSARSSVKNTFYMAFTFASTDPPQPQIVACGQVKKNTFYPQKFLLLQPEFWLKY